MLPYLSRLFMRRSEGRTIIGGVVGADLCPDGFDRITNGHILLIPSEQWRVYLSKGVQATAGCDLDHILTGDAFNSPDLDRSGWIREEVKR